MAQVKKIQLFDKGVPIPPFAPPAPAAEAKPAGDPPAEDPKAGDKPADESTAGGEAPPAA